MRLHRRPMGNVLLEGTAPPGHIYDVLATDDLVLWKAIGTVTADENCLFVLSDPAARNSRARFYQLHEVTFAESGNLPTLQITEPQHGELHLIVHGQVGHTYSILASYNSNPWTVINEVTVGRSGSAEMIAPAGMGAQTLFYRLQESR